MRSEDTALGTSAGATPGPRVTGHESRATVRPTRATSPDAQRRSAPREGRATTCTHCVYARRPTGLWLRLILSRWMGLLFCTNHPNYPGDVIGVPPGSRCRNFRAKGQRSARAEAPEPAGALVCTIPLTRRKVALVDAADYRWLMGFRWQALQAGPDRYYACAIIKRKFTYMHRLIMNPPKGKWIHHVDGNGLNNRRENLRICTPAQNARDRRGRRNSSTGFKGVTYNRRSRKFYAHIGLNGKPAHLGSFLTAAEAARAYDRNALEFFGEFARLNFPQERDQRLREIEAEKAEAARRREEPS